MGQGGEWSRVEREGEEWASISASKNRDLKNPFCTRQKSPSTRVVFSPVLSLLGKNHRPPGSYFHLFCR